MGTSRFLFMSISFLFQTAVFEVFSDQGELITNIFTKANQSYVSLDFSPIRLVFDVRFLEGLPKSTRTKIQNLLEYAQERISVALSVIPIEGNLFVPQNCNNYWVGGELDGKCSSVALINTCGEVTHIPPEHLASVTIWSQNGQSHIVSGGVGVSNADLLVYVTLNASISCDRNTLAYAVACSLDQMDRPIVGNINFCPNEALSSMLLIEQQNVVLHEMIHLLGFNTLLFSFYRNELGQPRTPRCPEASGCKSSDPPTFPPYNLSTNSFSVSQSTVATLGDLQYLVTPTVTDIARSYYGCELLIGAPLENDTTVLSAGSHWKQRLLLGELMTGQFVSTPVLSEFTLAALADSGWYAANFSAAGTPLLWGRGEGCAPFAAACGVSSFCAPQGAVGCTFDRSALGLCDQVASMLDGCEIFSPFWGYTCDNSTGASPAPAQCAGGRSCHGAYFGPGSACFDSNLFLGPDGAPPPRLCVPARPAQWKLLGCERPPRRELFLTRK